MGSQRAKKTKSFPTTNGAWSHFTSHCVLEFAIFCPEKLDIYIYIHDIYIYNKCNHMPTVTYNSYITLTLPMDSYWNMYGQQGQHTCKSSIGLAYLTAKPGYRDRWKIVLPVARDCAQKCRNLWYETIRNHPCQTMFDGCFMSTQTQIPSLFMISRIMFAMNIAI